MIDVNTVSFLFIKKEPFIGSDSGMRYRFTKEKVGEGDDAKDIIKAVVWPEPYCYEKTDEALKTYEQFPCTQDGCKEAVAWANEQLTSRAKLWASVNGEPLLKIM